jgi:hypothetical protein
MSNQSLNESISNNLSVSTQEIPSLDQLLYVLGFTEWEIITSTFVLPALSFIGLGLCTLSFWIFFQEKFKDPVFFYYRLLCLVYIIHLAHNIPAGILFTPRYFPKISTYSTSIYQIYNGGFAAILFLHFEETLQMGILLMRMKIFIPFVRRHFTLSPQIVSLIFFFTCVCIDFPVLFSAQVSSIGTYYTFDSNGSKNYVEFYYFSSSEFSATFLGRLLSGFTAFANLFLSTLVGIILNIVSFVKYKLYLKERRIKAEAYTSNRVVTTNQFDLSAMTSGSEIQRVTLQETSTSRRRVLTSKEINENRAEKNMFYMALILSCITLVSRVLIILCVVYFLIFYSFSVNLVISVINLSVQTFVPASSIFLFYFFNKIYREEFDRIVLKRLKTVSNEIELHQ